MDIDSDMYINKTGRISVIQPNVMWLGGTKKVIEWHNSANKSTVKTTQSTCSYTVLVESLEFVLAQFWWYSWVAFTYEFTSSTNTINEIVTFLIDTENRCIQEITSPRISKKTKNKKKTNKKKTKQQSTKIGSPKMIPQKLIEWEVFIM